MPALKQESPSSPSYLDPSKSLGEPHDIFVKLPNESTETSLSESKQEQEQPTSEQESTTEQGESKGDGAVSQETQTWNELKAAARFLSRDPSKTTSQVKANGTKTAVKIDDETPSKKEEDGETEETADKEKEEAEEEESELMKAANNASAKDTPLTTRLLAVAFLNALDRLDENDRNAASLQGCMQVLHLRLESHPHLTTENGGLLDLIARLSSSTRFGHLRLLFLSLIYNSTPENSGGLRLYVLVHTVHLSMITGLTGLVLPGVLERINGFLAKWGVGKREARKLYLVVAMALEQKGQREGAHTWYLKYLRTLDESEEEEKEGGDGGEEKGIAKKVMVDAINLKTIFRFDALMEMKAIKTLKEQKDCEKLCELSQIFVDGDVHDYGKWKEDVVKRENGKKLGDIEGLENVNEDMCLEKMRLLTFSSMGVEAQEMSYEEVSNGLEIEKEDVEDWVVRAIGVGLVDAKMDQLEEKVRIYRSTQRTFSRAEWAPLSDRINVWRANMADLLEALKAARQKSKENES